EMSLLMGGNLARILRGEPPRDSASPARDTHMPVSAIPFQRASEYLATAVHVEFSGGDSHEAFELAYSALDLPPDHESAEAAWTLRGAAQLGEELVSRHRDGGLSDPTRHLG